MKLLVIAATVLFNFSSIGSAEIVLSKEIRAQIDPPEQTTTSPFQQQPVILSNPSKVSVPAGSTVVFPCRLDKQPGQRVIVWKWGKTRVLFAGSLRVAGDPQFSLVDNSTTLQITNVSSYYAGEYICQLKTNPPAELTHVLHVLVPPSITVEPDDGHVIAKKGDPVLVRCNTEGYPPPTVTWTALSGHLPGRQKEKQGNVLSIASAELHHNGVYQCTAENGVGGNSTALIKIKVLYAPEVSVSPSWLHAGLGSTAQFRCSATADPSASLYWTRLPKVTLREDDHISFESIDKASKEELVMRIRRITQEHFGSYACFANNSIDSAFKTVQISGLAEPVRFKSNNTSEDNESFLLMWTVKSYSPVIEYMMRIRQIKRKEPESRPPWIDVMIPVEARQSVLHSDSYNITGLEPGTRYEVVMQARNDFGWNHPSETFTFYTNGGAPQADEWEKPEVSLLPVIMTEASIRKADSEYQLAALPENHEQQQHPNIHLLIMLLLVVFAL